MKPKTNKPKKGSPRSKSKISYEGLSYEGLDSLFARLGGKSKLVKEILPLFPKNYENMLYVEPFVGGGSIYFAKIPSKVADIINDLDQDIYDMYNDLKNVDSKTIKSMDFSKPVDVDLYKKFRDMKERITDPAKRLYRNLYVSYKSYGGMRTSVVPKGQPGTKGTKLQKIDEYKKRMQNTIITNLDYAKLMKCTDHPNTLFYLDPPYLLDLKVKHYKEDKGGIDYKYLFDLVCTIKGKVIVSINEDMRILEYATTGVCKNKLYLYELDVKYTIAGRFGSAKKKKEFVITNFPVPGKKEVNIQKIKKQLLAAPKK